MLPSAKSAQRHLLENNTGALDALRVFQQKHISIVTRYVIIPSRKLWEGTPSQKNLASSSSSAEDDKHLVGTGGTALVLFLRLACDGTTQAGKPERYPIDGMQVAGVHGDSSHFLYNTLPSSFSFMNRENSDLLLKTSPRQMPLSAALFRVTALECASFAVRVAKWRQPLNRPSFEATDAVLRFIWSAF